MRDVIRPVREHEAEKIVIVKELKMITVNMGFYRGTKADFENISQRKEQQLANTVKYRNKMIRMSVLQEWEGQILKNIGVC